MTGPIGPAEGLQSKLNGPFANVVLGQHGDPRTRYLFTVDERGINIALEQTPALTPRGHIVHTNLSQRASFGGEVWFGPNNTVTINAGSGRFGYGSAGATREQYQETIRLWKRLGYNVNAILFEAR